MEGFLIPCFDRGLHSLYNTSKNLYSLWQYIYIYPQTVAYEGGLKSSYDDILFVFDKGDPNNVTLMEEVCRPLVELC